MLLKRIRDGEIETSESVADAYGGVFEFAFKGTEEAEAVDVFRDSLKPLFEQIERGFRNSQIMASMALMKII